MINRLASSEVESGLKPQSGQTIDYEIDNCCFSAKHAALRSKTNVRLTRNQNIVSK
jgi:hypothetical protein